MVTVAVCALAFVIALLGTLGSNDVDGTELKPDQYFTLLEQGRISTATILTPHPRIKGTYDRSQYWLSMTPDAEGELVSRLQTAGVPLREVHHGRAGAVVPLGLAVLALLLLGAGLAACLGQGYAAMTARVEGRRGLLLVLVPLFAVSLGLLAAQVLWMSPSTAGRELRTDQYLTLLNQGRIDSATLLEADRRIRGTYDRGPYWLTVSLPAVRSVLESEHAQADLRIEVDDQVARRLVRPAAYGLSIVVFLLAALLVGALTVDFSGRNSRPQRS